MHTENNNTPTSRQELGSEAISDTTEIKPKKEADMRIAHVSSFASTADRRDMMHSTLNASDYAIKREAERIMNITKWDTLDVLDGKIDKMKASIAQDEKDYQGITVGRDMDTVFKMGGLFGKTTYQAEYEGIVKQKEALEELKKMRIDVAAMTSIDDVKAARKRLGLPELPQSVVGDYDRHLAMAMQGNAERDRSLEVDWMAINGKLKQAEVVLDRWTTCLETLDTGVGIAAGLIPYGSEVYEISKALTDVAVGTKTPEQAAQEFIIGVISSHVGGKALKKMKVDEYVGNWVKKNSRYFSAKTSEALARVTGKTAAGATQGTISGTTEGVMHGTVDVATGKKTVGEAVTDTKRRAITGAVFGGAMGGGMEGVKIRGESKRAAQLADNRARIMALPDTPEGKTERLKAAGEMLGEEVLDASQETAIIKAHEVPRTGTDADGNATYSPADLAEKAQILKEAGFTKKQRRTLMENGVCGNTPPPVYKKGVLPPPPPKREKSPQALVTPVQPKGQVRIPLPPPPPPRKLQQTTEAKPTVKTPDVQKEAPPNFRPETQVLVRRDNGSAEPGWTVQSRNADGTYTVRKYDDKTATWNSKNVTTTDLESLNYSSPEFAAQGRAPIRKGQEVYVIHPSGAPERGWRVERSTNGRWWVRRDTLTNKGSQAVAIELKPDQVAHIHEVEGTDAQTGTMPKQKAFEFMRMMRAKVGRNATLTGDEFDSLFDGEMKQSNVGNCYLIAAFNSLKRSPYFEAMMRTSVRKTKDGYAVKFPLGGKDPRGEILISDADIGEHSVDQSTDKYNRKILKPVDASPGWQILEAAFLKLKSGTSNRIDMEGGHSEIALKQMFGDAIAAKVIQPNSYTSLATAGGKEQAIAWLKNFHKGKTIAAVSSVALSPQVVAKAKAEGRSLRADEVQYEVKMSGKNVKLYHSHAYSVENVNRFNTPPTVMIKNPHDTSQVMVFTFEEFAEAFSGYNFADVDFDKLFAS